MKQTEQISLDPQNYHYLFSFQGICWIGGAMLALAATCVRFVVKDLIRNQDEKWSEKQEVLERKFDEKLKERVDPMKDDIHYIKNHLAGRDAVMLQVLEFISENKKSK